MIFAIATRAALIAILEKYNVAKYVDAIVRVGGRK